MKNMKKIIAVLMSLSAITMTTSAFAKTDGIGEAKYDAASGAVSLSTEQLPTDEGKQLTVVIVPTDLGEKAITSGDIYYINQGDAATEFAGIIEAMKVKTVKDENGNEVEFAATNYEVRIGGALPNDYYVYKITGEELETIAYGNVNGDKDENGNAVINGLDAIALAQYLVEMDVTIDEKATNVAYDFEEDGVTPIINGLDAIRLAQYLVEMDVVLGPTE